MSIAKSTVRSIGAEIAALPQVKELLKKYGLATVEYAGGTINPDSFVVKVKFGAEAKSGNSAAKAATQHGLPADVVGKVIRLGNSNYTITDIKPQNAQGSLKKCVVITGSGGGRYVTTAAEVLRALGVASTGISSKNGLPAGTLVKRPVPGMEGVMTPELKAKFESLAGRLSPENLSCDGELSKLQINIRKAEIMKEWRALEAELGRDVPFSEFPY